MSELAYSQTGEPFEVPTGATGWRVKRLKQKGAPEVVYSREGSPLVLAIDDGIDELRAAVDGAPGRYRLDPIGDDAKQVANAPSGYVFIHPEPATPTAPNLAALHALATLPAASPLPPASDSIAIEMLRMHTEGMREAMRQNAQIASAVVAAFPSVMGATGTVLAAADGAGLPARPPRSIAAETVAVAAVEEEERADDDDEDDDDEEAAPRSPLAQFGNAIAAQLMPLMPVLAPAMAQKLGGALGIPALAPSGPATAKALALAPDAAAVAAPSAWPPPTVDPAVLAKLAPLYMQLAPSEQLRATKLALELSAGEQAAFAEQLAALPPEAALAKLRALIDTDDTGAVS